MARDSQSDALHAAFVAGLEPYVRARLALIGSEAVPGVDDAIAEAVTWLDTALGELLDLPYAEQRRSPLELFQEAMTAPTRVLQDAGVEAPDRDEVAVVALPGDIYELAPASSQEVGEEAWSAHLAWGVAKAAAIVRPTIAIVSRNLMDAARLESAVTGYRRVDWPGERPAVALVDLDHPDADEAVRTLADDGVTVVAYGPHVDDVAMTRARSLGAKDAVPRSRLFRDPEALLPELM